MAKTPRKRQPVKRMKRARQQVRPPEAAVAEAPPPPRSEPDFPIVGVGASAGGLEAFSQLLGALPPKPGLAIILIQHLAPQHASALPSLLAGVSTCPVVQAREGMQ